VDPLHLSRIAEAIEICDCVCGGGPNRNYAKVGHSESRDWSRDLLANFGTPTYLRNG